MDSTFFHIIAIIAIAFQGLSLFLFFFEPGLRYRVTKPFPTKKSGKEYFCELEKIAGAQIHEGNKIEVLENGNTYYPAELEEISRASKSICLEAYIFQRGKVASRFIEALAERARNGVKVHLVTDALGSFATTRSYLKDLIEAGGRVEFYHPMKWYLLPRYNHRTHREIIVIDGTIGFTGGSGIADHWFEDRGKNRRWRDTMFRVEGPCVSALQTVFCENWLETSGEILIGEDYFPEQVPRKGKAEAMVIGSTPSAGRSTRSRIVFQTLLSSATRSIQITTPYFLPDFSLRNELVRARQRGVDVEIITPGKKSDHLLTRRSSRRLYGSILKAGGRIYEYASAMIHAKILIIDGIYSVVGTTNFDNRSFGLNDEVNLISSDKPLAERLAEAFARDKADAEEITYEKWSNRPFFERFHEWGGALLERQQ